MAFNYYHSYYGYSIGVQIRGQIGKKFIYQRIQNVQIKYPYKKPTNPRTTLQQAHRARIRQAVWAWQNLTENQKNFYRQKEPIRPIMSGYNYFISQYILQLLEGVIPLVVRTLYHLADRTQYILAASELLSIWTKLEQANAQLLIVTVDEPIVWIKIFQDDEQTAWFNINNLYDANKLGLLLTDGVYVQYLTYDAGTPQYTYRVRFNSSRHNTKFELKLHNTTGAQKTINISFLFVRDKIL